MFGFLPNSPVTLAVKPTAICCSVPCGSLCQLLLGAASCADSCRLHPREISVRASPRHQVMGLRSELAAEFDRKIPVLVRLRAGRAAGRGGWRFTVTCVMLAKILRIPELKIERSKELGARPAGEGQENIASSTLSTQRVRSCGANGDQNQRRRTPLIKFQAKEMLAPIRLENREPYL